METINPESSVEAKIDIPSSDMDVQSQLSTSIDTQSLKDIDSLPCFSTEVQKIPNLISGGRNNLNQGSLSSSSVGQIKSNLVTNSNETLPSDQIRELMQPPTESVGEVTPE